MTEQIYSSEEMVKAVAEAVHIYVKCGSMYFPVTKEFAIKEYARIWLNCKLERDAEDLYLWISPR